MVLHRCLLALACLPLMLASISSQAAPLYSVTLLPGADFAPADMNNAGEIVGRRYNGLGYVAVSYSNGIQTDLAITGAAESYASAINDAGTITGTFLAPSDQVYGFVLQNGSMRDLGAGTAALGMNAQGDIVGTTQTTRGQTGFVYRNGTLTELGNLGTGTIGQAFGINDHGQIVGTSSINSAEENAPTHPFLYSDGALQDLGPLAGRTSNGAVAINNAGQVAGYGDGADGTVHAFLYAGGVMQDLGGLGSNFFTVADLNQHGTLVGTAFTPDNRSLPFMNLDGALVDLNTLIDPTAGWSLLNAFAINDLDQIAAYGCNGSTCGLIRLDMTSAVPEPAAAWLLLPGLMLLAGRRRLGMRPCRSHCRSSRGKSKYHPILRRLCDVSLVRSILSRPDRRWLASLLTLLALLSPAGFCQASAVYTVIALPDNFNPVDINNVGQMAGVMYSTQSGPHAAIYDNGLVVDLGTFGGAYSYATALNENGMVIGNFGGATGKEHGFLFQNGSGVDIGAVNALAINIHGDVVGQQVGPPLEHGATSFLYSHGALTELGHLGAGDVSRAVAINDAGQIAGESDLTPGGQGSTHPYLYDRGALTDLGTLASSGVNSAVAINNAGQVAGYSDAGNGRLHVFTYEQGIMTDLGSFGGLDVTIGGMNQQGQIVGTGNTPDGPDVAFISSSHGLVDLNTLIDATSGWTLTNALDINDRGQIVANACRDRQCSAVRLDLASPVPEPGAPMLLISGLLAAAGYQRRPR